MLMAFPKKYSLAKQLPWTSFCARVSCPLRLVSSAMSYDPLRMRRMTAHSQLNTPYSIQFNSALFIYVLLFTITTKTDSGGSIGPQLRK